MNAVERKPVPTRALNPNASEASYKPKQRNYRKTKLQFFIIFFFGGILYGGFYPGTGYSDCNHVAFDTVGVQIFKHLSAKRLVNNLLFRLPLLMNRVLICRSIIFIIFLQFIYILKKLFLITSKISISHVWVGRFFDI